MPFFQIRDRLMYCVILNKSEFARNRKNASLFYNPEKSVDVKLDSFKHAGLFKPLLKFFCDGGGCMQQEQPPSLFSLKLFQY